MPPGSAASVNAGAADFVNISSLAKTTEKPFDRDLSLPLVIVNPRSAGGSTETKWSRMASEMRTHFGAFHVEFTTAPGSGTDIAASAASAGRSLIIACGGDGTINEVANGILSSGKDVELGILPSGTGGDLRRTLNIPHSVTEAAASLRDGETRHMDVGKVAFNDHDGRPAERYFLNVSSVGLAPLILKRVKKTGTFDWLPVSSVRGRANYAVSTLQEIMSIAPRTIRVRFDGGDENTVQTLNFCVANARYFGGGMMIAPDAKINDGRLDVINIGDISTFKILLNSISLYRGTHLDLKEVNSTLAAHIEVRAVDEGEPMFLETDGELPGKLPATFSVIPNALRIRVPRH